MDPLNMQIIRHRLVPASAGKEGFCQGRIYIENRLVGFTVEDEDRHLESGGEKVYGKTAMPLGTYELTLYQSPKHGLVPLFHDVPQFSFTEIHKANRAEELLGCVGIGAVLTDDGVANCAPALARVVTTMREAIDKGRRVFCTIQRGS